MRVILSDGEDGIKYPGESVSAADEVLLLSAKKNDGSALDELMGRYKNMVRSKAAMYFLSGGDRDDLIQEGMIGLYKAVCDYNPEKGSFYSFAVLCVTRQIMSAVKASARQKHQPLNESISLDPSAEAELDLENLPDTFDNDPASLLVGQETYRNIGSALKERLTPLEYDVFTRHIGGATRDEIAAAVGRDKKSVDNTLQRARKKMEKAHTEISLK